MFERFTERAILLVMLAQEEARRLQHNFLGTEVLLLGVLGEGRSASSKALKQAGINLKDARIEVEKIIGRGAGSPIEIPFTPRAKTVLILACEAAELLNQGRISPDHVLLGLISEAHKTEGVSVASRVLNILGVDIDQLEAQIIDAISSTG